MNEVLTLDNHLAAGSTAVTIGMFDGVHRGHAFLIGELKRHAAERGLTPMVVTFDRHPLEVVRPARTPALLMTQAARIAALQAQCEQVAVLTFDQAMAQLSTLQFLELLRDNWGVKLLVMGYNHRFGHEAVWDEDHYKQCGQQAGVEVIVAPAYDGPYAPISSSFIRNNITRGEVDAARDMLGHPFVLQGRVVHGNHNGTSLGYPTANVGDIDPALIVPRNGAYAAVAILNGNRYNAMVGIGYRPTLTQGVVRSIEAHLIDQNGNFYGKDIALEMVGFIRPEIKFDDASALRHQLDVDRKTAINLLTHYHDNNGNH